MMLLILACTLALASLAGCGKSEPGKDETVFESTDDAQDVEDVLNGGWADAEEEEDTATVTRPTHYDVLPEVANATIADGGIYQIGDIVLYDGCRMSEEDVKKAVENSKTGAVWVEKRSQNMYGEEICLSNIYDEYEYDIIAIMEWKYAEPGSILPVPKAGYYLYDIMPSGFAEENLGITDSMYFTGGYCLSDSDEVKSNSKTHDEIIAELGSLGCEKVDELPNSKSLSLGDKGYYTDSGKNIKYVLPDNYWTGKTRNDGSSIVYPLLGEAYFDESGVCTRIN